MLSMPAAIRQLSRAANKERPSPATLLFVLGAIACASLTLVPVSANAQLYDHLRCYRVKDVKTFASAHATLDALDPEFGAADCQIKPRAKLVCVPTAKSAAEVVGGDPIPFDGQDLSDVRFCYPIKCPRDTVADQQITDPYGTRSVTKFRSNLVCTPAIIGTPPSSVTTSVTTTPTTTMPVGGGTRDPYLWPFDTLSPWNHPLGSGATFAAAGNAMTVALHAGATALNVEAYSHPVYLAQPTDPLNTVSLPNYSVQYQIASTATADPGADHHMHVVTTDRLFAHELWRASKIGTNHWVAEDYGKANLLGSGIAPHAGINVGTRAYGGSAIGGLIRSWEVEIAGVIRHALAISLMPSQLTPGPVWPATTEDPPSQYSGSIPMGTLIAIKPGVNLATLGLSAPGRIVAQALQDYGAYVVDQGANGPAFYADPTLSPGQASQIRADLPSLLPLLYPVLNNGPNNVGGGGTPRAEFAPPAALVLPPKTARVVVAAIEDDAEECLASGEVDIDSIDLDFGSPSSTFCAGTRAVGLRFDDLAIPHAATITSARVQMTAADVNADTTALTIRGHLVSQADPFTTATANVSSRPTTSAFVSWNPPTWGQIQEVGTPERTPDLRTIVQQIVNTPGWQPGNALALIVSGSGRRVARAFDRMPGSAPMLEVTWQ